MISTSIVSPALPDRDVLTCVTEGMAKLEDTHAGDPIEGHKALFTYTRVQIEICDRGSPTGNF